MKKQGWFLVILFFLVPVFAQNTQWVSYEANTVIHDAIELNGYLWLATNGGVVKYNLADGSYVNYNRTNSDLAFDNVYCVTHDQQGNLWFGTFFGACKFDGTNWQTFNTENSGLPWNMVNDIAVAPNGDVWFATLTGLARLSNGDWTVFNSSNTSVIKANNFSCVTCDSRGNVWAGTTSDYYNVGGLYKFDGTQWTEFNPDSSGIPDYYINDIAIDASDNVWVGMRSGGLAKFDGTNWQSYNRYNSSILDDNVRKIFIDRDQNVWIAMEEYVAYGGVNKFDGSGFPEFYCKSTGTFPAGTADMVLVTSQGEVFAGADGKGLVKLVDGHFQSVFVSNCGLPSNAILSVFVDSRGVKWFGTNGAGLVKYDSHTWQVFTRSNSDLPDSVVTCIAEDQAGNIWAGTHYGAVKIDAAGTMTLYNRDNTPNIYGKWIYDIVTKDNKVYLATDKGYSVFDGSNWTLHDKGNMSNFPALFDEFYAIAVDENDNVWLAVNGYGVIKYDGTTCVGYTPSNSGLTYAAPNALAIDSDGNIWVGCFGESPDGKAGGLYKFDGTNWTNYRRENSGMVADWVETVKIDAQGKIWTGGVQFGGEVNGGFAIFDGTNWQSFNRENSSLPYPWVKDIAFDANGNAWIGLNGFGVVVYNENGVVGMNTPVQKMPHTWQLKQNYPNPFNPTTTIVYQLPRKQHVTLTVFNALGQKVAELVNATQSAGVHSVKFNAQGLPSGVYFYRLRNARNQLVKKMLLVR